MAFRPVLLCAAASLFAPALAWTQAPPCPPPDTLAPWARVQCDWQSERGQHWSHDSLRRALLRLRDEDQRDRTGFGERLADTAYVRALVARDSTRARTVKGILTRFGVPGRRMVGAAGADAFMLLVQHDAALQATVVESARSLPDGELSPTSLAMLEDRVNASRGLMQRYGTHFTIGPDTMFHLAPTADLAGLESRRARVGLPPLGAYVCMMEEAGMRVNRRSLPR